MRLESNCYLFCKLYIWKSRCTCRTSSPCTIRNAMFLFHLLRKLQRRSLTDGWYKYDTGALRSRRATVDLLCSLLLLNLKLPRQKSDQVVQRTDPGRRFVCRATLKCFVIVTSLEQAFQVDFRQRWTRNRFQVHFVHAKQYRDAYFKLLPIAQTSKKSTNE